MNIHELKLQELKTRLTIKVNYEEGGRAYFCGDHKLTVKLLFDDEVISESTTSIPNNDRGSAY